jgi:hypothetical protein
MSPTERLAARLSEDCTKTLAFFHELSPEIWSMTLYTEGSQWTVREVLAHFLSAELSFQRLIANVAAGGSGVPEDFDIDSYNEIEVAGISEFSFEILLDKWVEARSQTAALVKSLNEADLSKEGRHPFLGIVPLEDMVKLVYRHNQIHLRDIRRLITS